MAQGSSSSFDSGFTDNSRLEVGEGGKQSAQRLPTANEIRTRSQNTDLKRSISIANLLYGSHFPTSHCTSPSRLCFLCFSFSPLSTMLWGKGV
ncbi:Uncharacterized protein APZ42_016197 [Daphnia magna]|uniref:Uncharacterized protein n=1 Tax=Daphnia magna TaxID=35525 RepID=A0A165AJD9_9CRUS|nr:Uncharacterized protein APZ42_016197 [Daphnia magna]